MGNSEEGKPSKSDKSSSPVAQDQTNIHVYPDWAAMQAYYGPRIALPPYYNSAVASGHAPHPYMWAPPQPMMPPYGAPYAVYSHGGVYAHPAVPMGPHPHGPGAPPSPAAATPLDAETPTKSIGNTDRGLMKKLKGFDGLAMSIGNGNDKVESAEDGEHRLSQSEETEGSSDGSDGNSTGARKRSPEGAPTIGKSVGLVVSPAMTSTPEIKNSAGVNPAMASPTGVTQTPVLPSDAWLQNERELKRERRKQSNRESARRSRLRKQAETEELARKVESLAAENVTLKSEINQLTERSKTLRLENAVLTDKLKNTQLGHPKGIFLKDDDEQMAPAASTENLLARVNASADRNTREDDELYERNPKSGAKLHQLLDTSPRTDAVPAS